MLRGQDWRWLTLHRIQTIASHRPPRDVRSSYRLVPLTTPSLILPCALPSVLRTRVSVSEPARARSRPLSHPRATNHPLQSVVRSRADLCFHSLRSHLNLLRSTSRRSRRFPSGIRIIRIYLLYAASLSPCPPPLPPRLFSSTLLRVAVMKCRRMQ